MLSRLRSQPIHRKLYIAGFFASALATPVIMIARADSLLRIGLGAISPILFTLGFIIWIWPVLSWALQADYIKAAFAITNIALIALATVISRNAVSIAIGLPSTDFDLTVTIVRAIAYPVALLMVLSILSPLLTFALMLLGLTPSRYKERIKILRVNMSDTAFGSIGSVATGIITFGLLVALTSQDNFAKSVILRIAYYADYQLGTLYPGVDHSLRYRLHENGIVSYAIENGRGISIRIDKVAPDQDDCMKQIP